MRLERNNSLVYERDLLVKVLSISGENTIDINLKL